MKRIGQLAGLPGVAVAERLGPVGRRAWSLAEGGERGASRGAGGAIAEALEFPEAVANELTLRRGFASCSTGCSARGAGGRSSAS